MRDTYETVAEADVDRAQQRALLVALNVWDRALRRDECGAWTLIGERGTVHTWGDGKTWVLYAAGRSVRHWTASKARLSFCSVTQDGDDEGCLRLHRLPTAQEAEIIRDVLGLRKRREISEEDRQRLIAAGAKTRLTAKEQGSAPPSVG